MSNKKKAKHQSKKSSVAQNIAGGAVGTIFNVVLIIVAVMLIYYLAVSAYQYGVRIYGEPAISEEPGTEINVTITDGMDFKGIAKQLCEKGLVREERLFYIQERLSNYSEDGFVAGDYVLSTAMTPDEMMDVMRTFINSLDPGEPAWLDEIRSSALQDNVPIIRMEMGSLLRFLLTLRRPSSILEVGTAVGYSALFMSEYMPENCHITTIEKYEKRIPIAKQNFKTAGREDKITLLEGDAAEILAELSQPFDFIFMDAAKGQYMHFLPDVLRLLAPGGLLVSDNVLQEGNIIESRYAVCRRDRTIHARMREYLYTLTHHDELETVVLPVGDGATLSVKLPEKEQNAQP